MKIPLPEGWVEWVPHIAFAFFAMTTFQLLIGALNLPPVSKKADADVVACWFAFGVIANTFDKIHPAE